MYFKYFKTLTIYVFIISLFNVSAYAQLPHQGVGVYLDQDLFIPFSNEDRDYTMGLAIEFFSSEKNKGLYIFDDLFKKTSELLGINVLEEETSHSIMLGILTYTPDDLTDKSPIYDDRPYSSLVFLSNKQIQTNYQKATVSEVLIGLLGTSISRELQSGLHSFSRNISNNSDPPEPKGWGNQISQGGELTMRLRLANSQLQLSSLGSWDIATTFGGSLGFQTNVSASIALRFGDIKSPFWSLPYDQVTRGNFLPPTPKKEWYIWSSFRAHLIAYDALLQGQFRHSEVKYSFDEIKHWVYDGALGLTLGFQESQITLSANFKSSDLKNTSRHQVWGSINYVYYY